MARSPKSAPRKSRRAPNPVADLPIQDPVETPNYGFGLDMTKPYQGLPPIMSTPQTPDAPPAEPMDVEVPNDPTFDPIMDSDGAMQIQHPDGSMTIDLAPQTPSIDDLPFDGNLAEVIDPVELGRIAMDLMDGIETDDQSRKPWLDDQARAIELLGLKLEEPKAGSGSAPLDHMSVVRHPLLLEACQRFHSNAMAEMLPAAGPVKIMLAGKSTVDTSKEANVLEDMMNYYLTETATEFYPDTDRMLFRLGLSGMAFKKVYCCPIRRRPVSESVNGSDLIISDSATDLDNASRVTHRIDMRRSVMRRMQLVGAYRDVPLGDSTPEPDPVQRAVADMQGIQIDSGRPEDQDYEIYECYCELDIAGLEHKEDGEPTGLPLPYKVTIERTSKEILEIRRNWKESDTDYTRKLPFVPYTYQPGLGFWGIGLLNILGNMTSAATAGMRMMLDASMFANFPGFLVAEEGARQLDNNLRVGPGEGKKVKTNGMKLSDAVMALPYKDPSQASMELLTNMIETGRRVGQTAEMQVGEGRQDAPVGTTLALLDQSTKVMAAVHKRMHQAQKRELNLLLDLIKEDPEVLWRRNPRAVLDFNIQPLLAALENISIVPCSDPNTPSRSHRLAQVQAQIQLATQAAQAGVPINAVELYKWASNQIGTSDPERFVMQQPPQGPQQNPALAMQAQELQLKGNELQFRTADTQMKYADKAAERATKEKIATLKLAETLAVHPAAEGVVDNEIAQLAPIMGQPTPPQGMMPPAQPPMPPQGMQPSPAPMPINAPIPMRGSPQSIPREAIAAIARNIQASRGNRMAGMGGR